MKPSADLQLWVFFISLWHLFWFFPDYTSNPDVDEQEVQLESEHCNDKKSNAKIVSEASSDLFLAAFVKVSKTPLDSCP